MLHVLRHDRFYLKVNISNLSRCNWANFILTYYVRLCLRVLPVCVEAGKQL